VAGSRQWPVAREEHRTKTEKLRQRIKAVALQFYFLGRGKTDWHMEPFFVELSKTLFAVQEKKA
jgi:hypothetical protein